MEQKDMSFETAFLKLEEIAQKLDNNSISLDESLKLFEQGVKLSEYCNSILTKAREKIDSLRENEAD